MEEGKRGAEKLAISFGWLHNLIQAAILLLQLEAKRDEEGIMLVKYGQRRAKKFLCEDLPTTSPFFGLCNPHVLQALSEEQDLECGIQYLRNIAKQLCLTSNEAVIYHSYRPRTDKTSTYSSGKSYEYREYITAVPHARASNKRNTEGDRLVEDVDARWLRIVHTPHLSNKSDPGESARDYVDCEGYKKSRMDVSLRWNEQFIYLGIRDGEIERGITSENLKWDAPPVYRSHSEHSNCLRQEGQGGCPSLTRTKSQCNCLMPALKDNHWRGESLCCSIEHTIVFSRLIGEEPLALYIRKDSSLLGPGHLHSVQKAVIGSINPLAAIEHLRIAGLAKARLFDYLCCVAPASDAQDCDQIKKLPGMYLLAIKHKIPRLGTLSLHGLSIASCIYENLGSATISLKLLNRSIHKASWLSHEALEPQLLEKNNNHGNSNSDTHVSIAKDRHRILECLVPKPLNRAQAFACISNFDSGTLQLDQEDLSNVLALCSENSIYVAGVILSDPFEKVSEDDIRHIVGNIGRTGICMLVAPQDPRIRPLSDEYNVVAHQNYDFERQDNFKGTSLHLSFTDWVVPLEVDGMRTIDQDVHFVESVVAVYYGCKWVADLDILGIDFQRLIRLEIDSSCPGSHNGPVVYDYTSIDSWEEFLDKPDCVGIFRAHGNWPARLAAVSILSQQDQIHSVGIVDSKESCLKCLEANVCHLELGEYESPLPSICID